MGPSTTGSVKYAKKRHTLSSRQGQPSTFVSWGTNAAHEGLFVFSDSSVKKVEGVLPQFLHSAAMPSVKAPEKVHMSAGGGVHFNLNYDTENPENFVKNGNSPSWRD